MENPYEAQQTLLLGRIINNVDKLNEAMVELTSALNSINAHNTNLAAVNEMWSSYMNNVRFNLEREDNFQPPK